MRRSSVSWIVASLAVVCLVLPAVTDVPVPSIERAWSIGVYEGASPFALAPARGARNPVLTAADVTDVPAAFVADPFVARDAGAWHLLFEVFNRRTRRGEIGWAVSDDLLHWRYRAIVLRESFHLSYPYVFQSDGSWYLVPESSAAGEVRLYRATRFPAAWHFEATIVRGALSDPSVIKIGDRWWLFAEAGANQSLNAYFADRLTGPWQPHRRNPVVAGAPDRARPGGRVLIVDGRPLRFAQIDRPSYGRAVRAFAVTALTPDTFEQVPVGDSDVVSATADGWNARGMHHVDPVALGPDRWVALVDGQTSALMFGIRRFSWRQLFRGRP